MRIEKPYLSWDRIDKYYDMKSPTIHTLPNNLMRNTIGHAATPMTDFFPLSREGVLALGVGKVEAWDDTPWIREYELSRIPKYGEQGLLPPLNDPARWQSLMKYMGPFRPCNPSGKAYRYLKHRLQTANLVPWSFEQVLAYQVAKGKLSSAGGPPLNMKRSKGADWYIDIAREGVLQNDATVVANRYARKKLRTIFMASMSTNERELRWIYPVMEWMKSEFTWFEAWKGQDYVEQAVTPWNSRGRTFISADYSAMDTTCGPDQFHMMYDLVKWAFPRRYWAEFKADVLHAVNVPKIVGAGFIPGNTIQGHGKEYRLLVLHGTSANPAGDAWNQFLECWLSALIWVDMMLESYVDDFQLLGDDSVGYSSEEYAPGVIEAALSKKAAACGMVMNPEKQEVSTHQFHYLQRYYEIDETMRDGVWRGSYPFILALNSAKNPERDNISRYDNARERRTIAWISIAENCKWNPHFHEIVDLFVEGDPNRLGLGTDLWYNDALFQEMRARGQLPASAVNSLPTRLMDSMVVKYLMEKVIE